MRFELALLGVLLAGTLLSPVASIVVFGSASDARHRVSTLVFAAAAVAATFVLRARATDTRLAFSIRLLATAGVAVPIALVLDKGVNAFYTSRSLVGGMLVLLVLHVLTRLMRYVAAAYREDYVTISPTMQPAPTTRGRFSIVIAPQRPRVWRVTLPAVVLADAISSVSAWSLLVFWVLVAIERRHAASLVLVFVSVLLMLEWIILIPDTLAGWGLLPRAFDAEAEEAPAPHPLALVRG